MLFFEKNGIVSSVQHFCRYSLASQSAFHSVENFTLWGQTLLESLEKSCHEHFGVTNQRLANFVGCSDVKLSTTLIQHAVARE